MKVHLGAAEVCEQGLRWRHEGDEGTAGGVNGQQIKQQAASDEDVKAKEEAKPAAGAERQDQRRVDGGLAASFHSSAESRLMIVLLHVPPSDPPSVPPQELRRLVSNRFASWQRFRGHACLLLR